jgi:hypothetical protein
VFVFTFGAGAQRQFLTASPHNTSFLVAEAEHLLNFLS